MLEGQEDFELTSFCFELFWAIAAYLSRPEKFHHLPIVEMDIILRNDEQHFVQFLTLERPALCRLFQ